MIIVIRFFYILVTHNLIIPKKWLHSLNSEYATFFTVFYFVTASFFDNLTNNGKSCFCYFQRVYGNYFQNPLFFDLREINGIQ